MFKKKLLIVATMFATLFANADMVLFDASKDADKVSPLKAKVEKLPDAIKVSYDDDGTPHAGIAINLKHDISQYTKINFEIDGNATDTFTLVLENPNVTFGQNAIGYRVYKKPLNSKSFEFEYTFSFNKEVGDIVINERKMRGSPFGMNTATKFDTKNLTRIRLYMTSKKNAVWTLKKISVKKADKEKMPAYFSYTKEQFFPFIDKYGQFIHKEWKDKLHSDSDFQKFKELEEKDLAKHAGPADRNKWGGWESGPTFKATGHFRVEKINGKWWMIDPSGKLYWSHGVVRVTPHSAITPLDNRKFFFKELPSNDSPFAQFYFTHDELLRPYYVKRDIKETYDFSASNIMRKYGKDWRKLYGEICHKRLKSWGLNTIANSSDKNIFMMGKTPYIDRFEIKAPELSGSDGYWWKFRDPFNPKFAENVRKNLEERKDELADPWCIGIFVDNELNWGHPNSHAVWTFTSGENCVAKKVFINDLKNKYDTIENLNAIWGSKYASWDDMLKCTDTPPKASYDDCVKFSEKLIEEYYRIIRNEIKFMAPHMLYMGCRFAGIPKHNPQAMYIGAKYCDVISYNIYRDILDDVKLPNGIDKPIMIGEFHFGALDRGKFHTGLVPKSSQEERAQCYYNYVESALKHPNVIGTHWHQFADQATTGRFDGENFQVGFTDVCDTPYWETIAKIREIGYKMYEVRANKK